MKPEFVDNRDGNSMVAGLRGHLEWLEQTYAQAVELSIATGYFNVEGFGLLADRLEKLSKVRLLLGAEPIPPPARPVRKPGDPRGPRFEEKLVRQGIELNQKGLLHDRNLLEFAPATDAAIRRLLALLDSGKVQVRRYEKAFLHGKAYVFGTNEGTLVGSSNFTAAGLTTNLELNLGRYDPTPVEKVKRWFDDLWADAVPFDLAAIYEARYEDYAPYLIYLRVLWEMYGQELDEEEAAESRIRLTTFQSDGVWRARRIMNAYNGVLISDGVGLGKTFIAGDLMREAVEDNRQRVLLVAPAALRDGMWDRFLHDHQLLVECVSYEQLAAGHHLRYQPNEYAMVVVDESQAVRNPDTVRAQALRRLLLGKPPKKLVLLTATPVNNSLWDLYYLITLFVGHDGVFADKGIRSLKERFREVSQEDPDDLRPDMLFDILDSVTVRRTRHFVKKYYPNDRVIGPGGVEIAVQFPMPHVAAIRYSLDDVLPGFFDELKEALAPEDEDAEPLLTMARYCPSEYSSSRPTDESQLALVGLVRSGLLKRFESSIYAFGRTAQRMADSHQAFLDALESGYILTPQALEEWANIDNDEEWERLLQESGADDARDYDVARLRAAVESDKEILARFAARAASVNAKDDPKLAGLVQALAATLRSAKKEGLNDEDVRRKRKVIIFSYFADTVDWIEGHLQTILGRARSLADYRGRMASVAGRDSRGGISREAAVFGFAPESTQAPPPHSDDRFDILITTDVLSEGVNLQQCRNIVNYDLPWNPMRLVQRHGRVDRIGSRHSDVYLNCVFPDRRLNELLDLEARIRRKLAQAAATIGVEHEVIPGGLTHDVVFAETRAEIERLRAEDPTLFETAGEDPSAHSGEEYRQELRRAMQSQASRITALPWGAGSGLVAGKERGHFFCARVDDRLFVRFVPISGGPVERNTLKCLKRITCTEETPRHLPEDLAQAAYEGWFKARRDIFEEWMFATDPANIQPRIRPFFRKVADHLRNYPPTSQPQDVIDRTVESLEAPWGVRHERALREVYDEGAKDPRAVSAAVIEKVRELGLQPYVQPVPLPLIDEHEVTLVCWMAVDEAPDPAAATLPIQPR